VEFDAQYGAGFEVGGGGDGAVLIGKVAVAPGDDGVGFEGRQKSTEFTEALVLSGQRVTSGQLEVGATAVQTQLLQTGSAAQSGQGRPGGLEAALEAVQPVAGQGAQSFLIEVDALAE